MADGIGDTNYTIDTDSVDNYPLWIPAGIDYIVIMDGPSGTEGESPNFNVTLGFNFTVTVWAGGYNNTYGYVQDVNVTWDVINSLGATATITNLTGESTTFNSSWTEGQIILKATYQGTMTDQVNGTIARFQPDMMGSMVFTGELDVETAWGASDDDGVTVKDELERIGYLGNDELEAGLFLELHVEQGPVLHSQGLEVGVVEGVQGMAWWDGEYTGEANHAGTTPLHLRKDALLAAAELCIRLRETAEELGNGSVSTMGRLHPKPDIRNVVPGGAFFTVDFRQYVEELYEKGQEIVADLIREVSEKHGLECSLTQTVDAKPVRFDAGIVEMVERKSKELGLVYKRMHSGAGHDAQFMSRVCPTAMIFVPSIGGRSHCPEESTLKKDCVNGANVLLNCVTELVMGV